MSGRVAWYRLRVTFARRLRGYLGLVLLVALVGGIAMASLAAARRTQSAYPSFLASTNPSDLVVSSFGADTVTSSNNAPNTLTTAAMRRLPLVREVHSVNAVGLVVLKPNGAPDLGPVSTEVQFASSVDGFGFIQDRVAVVSGHLPPLTSTDQFVTTALGAQLLGIHVGQQATFAYYTQQQQQDPRIATGAVRPTFTVRATLAAVIVLNNQVVEDDIDRYPTFAIFPPAFTAQHPLASNATLFGLRLTHGGADVPRVEQEFAQAVPRGSTYEFHETSAIESRVERAILPESIALGAFGVIAAVAGLVISVLAVSRLVQATEPEIGVMRALGATPRTVVADQAIGAIGAAVLGAIAAGAVAVAMSPLAPLGPVRPVYPHRGIAIDWTVIGFGMLAFAVLLAASAVPVAWRGYRNQIRGDRRAAKGRRSSMARAASAAGLPTSVGVGVRFALEPGAGQTAVPVRSALLGATLAVVTVVATLTFGSSLHTLVSRPALYGWNWDYLLNATNNVPPSTLRALDHDPNVAGWTGFGEVEMQVDGINVPTLLTPAPEAVSPPILSGHSLIANNQIVLGPATLARLHKRVGDLVDVSYGVPRDKPVYVPPTPLIVVGTATMPAIGFSSLVADHTSMGTGALVPQDVQPFAMIAATSPGDTNLDGPAIVVVRLRPHVGAAAGLADLNRLADAANTLFAHDPQGGGASVTVQGVQRPAEIVNYRSTGATPELLAIGLAAGALVALALTLTSSVRHRRRELAVLKALGFTRRQIMTAVTVQALVPAVIGVVIGIPVGLALGRLLWDAFARSIYAVPQLTAPLGAIALVGAGAIAFAAAVATVPGLLAARVRAVTALRAE